MWEHLLEEWHLPLQWSFRGPQVHSSNTLRRYFMLVFHLTCYLSVWANVSLYYSMEGISVTVDLMVEAEWLTMVGQWQWIYSELSLNIDSRLGEENSLLVDQVWQPLSQSGVCLAFRMPQAIISCVGCTETQARSTAFMQNQSGQNLTSYQ